MRFCDRVMKGVVACHDNRRGNLHFVNSRYKSGQGRGSEDVHENLDVNYPQTAFRGVANFLSLREAGQVRFRHYGSCSEFLVCTTSMTFHVFEQFTIAPLG